MPVEFIEYWPLLLAVIAVPILALGLWWSLVDRPRAKLLGSWVLRVTGVVLLVLALCQPYMTLSSDDLHVVFLVDVSESVDLAAAEEAVADVEAAIEELHAGDSWSLFALGRGLRAFEDPEDLRAELQTWQEGQADDAFRSATEVAGALRRIRLAMPDGKARRVVLFSDHQPTDAAVVEAVDLLQSADAHLQIASIDGLADAEASVTAISPSTRDAFEGEMVRLTVRMATNRAMDAELRIVSRGAVVARKDVTLDPDGENIERVDVAMHTPGPSVWTAEIVPEADRFPINNQVSTTVEVHGQPRLLVLHDEPRQMREFSRAMEEQQFSIDVRPPRGLPTSMDELLSFDAIILAKAPATAMTTRQMMLLKRYVADFGGGLMMVGSEQSFGLGGYYRTPVEDVLPLVSRYEQEKEQPSMAMVLVIDKSGSMNGLPVALARQASKAAVELLGSRDQVGVVAFDSQAYIVSDMRSAADTASIQHAIDTIDAGGGTYMYAGMVIGRDLLQQASARIKHMIVLGDGQTQQADHFGLVDELLAMNVTVSTVALGSGADRALLSAIAEQGRGRYYETLDPNDVPQIFTQETMQASRSAIKEEVFGSVQVADHPALTGFEDEALPLTLGYVMTQARPTAQVLLVTETGDPLLAASRFGLGMGMAYTSDLTPRWGGLWLNWSNFGPYWAQVLRALIRKTDDAGLAVTGDADDEAWRVAIERLDSDGRPVTGITWDAEVVDAGGNTQPVRVEEVGMGAYQAQVPLGEHQRYTLRLHDTDHGKLKAIHYDRPYPAEYQLDGRVPDVLRNQPEFEAVAIREDLPSVMRGEQVMPWFVLPAIACLIAGIALRRI